MRKLPLSVVLAAMLLTGVAGCKDDQQASAPAPASPAAAASAAASVPASPASSAATPEPSATEAAPASPAPAGKAFPLAVTRTGGFAGVDDRATITADGTAMVTRKGGKPVRTALPEATMAELRRLLAAPDFARPRPADGATVCNDGYEYEFVSPSSRTVVQDCDVRQGATRDRVLAIVSGLFKA